MKTLITGIILFFFTSIKVFAYDIFVDGIFYNIDSEKKTAEVTFLTYGFYSGIINIPEQISYNGEKYQVNSIGLSAFEDCKDLEGIVLPNSIESIGKCAFCGCTSLTSIDIPNGVSFIGNWAFSGCTNLENVSIPNSVLTIGTCAFENCKKFTSLTIPQNVSYIGGNIITGSNNISTILVESGNTTYDSRDNCNAIIETATNTLIAGCKATIIPQDLINVGSSAFLYCEELEKIVIPNSIKSFGMYAFAYCPKLSEVISEIENPYKIDGSIFEGICSYAILRVPKGTKEMYQNLSSWTSKFNLIEEILNTYTLSIKAIGNGSVSYNETTIRSKTSSFTANEGTAITITLTPDKDYRVKSLTVNNFDVTASISNNQYTIRSINTDTYVGAEFEAIPPTTYTLSIKATGNGSVLFEDATIRESKSTFSVSDGAPITITLTPDEGYHVRELNVNGKDVTSSIINDKYTINNTAADTHVEAVFDLQPFVSEGIVYNVVSNDEKTVKVASGDFGLCTEIPCSFSAHESIWKVIGVEKDAFKSAKELAALIWNPETKFTEKISNPNLLFYVKSKDYAPSDISNIIVENKAEKIILTDAVEGNNFYCPQEFTAEQITYEHNYNMKSGYNSCQGWESIVLPFDVAMVTNSMGTELVPYNLWTHGDNKRPFWLCSMNEEGWKDESTIKANTPYIISMPNNENYDATYNITGNIVFSASNVTVNASDNLISSKRGHRNLVPNYQNTDRSSEIYALNVNNLWSANTDSNLAEGSAFIRDSRRVRPFEAYMTIDSGGGTTRSINIFDDDTTGIMNLPLACKNKDGVLRVYSLSGMLLKQGKDEKILNDLPNGVYVVNGKKIVK